MTEHTCGTCKMRSEAITNDGIGFVCCHAEVLESINSKTFNHVNAYLDTHECHRGDWEEDV